MSKVINGIALAALTATQAAIVNQARAAAPDKTSAGAETRKQIKREVFSVVKAKFGIPDSVKVKANTAGVDQLQYLVLHDKQGRAFRLNDDGQWDGTMVSKSDLFPPPPPAVDPTPVGQANTDSGSVFGGAAVAKWFRLDPQVVATVLTAQDLDYVDDSFVPSDAQGVDLPTPHLMLHGRDDLAITADGSIYRKQ